MTKHDETVHAAYRYFAGEDGIASPTMAELTGRTALSESTVRRGGR